MAVNFSGALKLTDLDDFITPSQECIKPVPVDRLQGTGKERDEGTADVRINSQGKYVEVRESTQEEIELKKTKITLNDCLACSGCITSAESVLITSQSQGELLRVLKEKEGGSGKIIVAAISPHARASLAAKFGMSYEECSVSLAQFLKDMGCDYFADTTFTRDFALMESQREFVARFKASGKLVGKQAGEVKPKGNNLGVGVEGEKEGSKKGRKKRSGTLPMLASTCPGWICYAEKTHGDYILPYISRVKSPQQIMGSVVKDYLAKQILNCSPRDIYHVTVMPCFDKKLEASRDDFYSDIYSSRDVDLVLTTGEIEIMLNEKGIFDMKDIEIPKCEDSARYLFAPEGEEAGANDGFYRHQGAGKGEFVEYIMRKSALELFGSSIEGKLSYKTMKNKDFQEVVLECDGEVLLKFAFAYGFRNIQNLVQKIKRNKCTYDFVEVLACPSGCLNGGGQVKPQSKVENGNENTPGIANTGSTQSLDKLKTFLGEVENKYENLPVRSPEDNIIVAEVYEKWLGNADDKFKESMLSTQYHEIEKNVIPLNIKW
eukprot:Nk52_evm7s179 gene=Nk52_evmTU7s179